MKKVLMFCSVPLLAFVLTLGLNACQHEDALAPHQQENIVGAEPGDSFEDMLQFGLENLGKDEQIEIFHKDGKIDWGVSRKTALGIRKHDCEGSVYAVVKCVGPIVKAGGCVIGGYDKNTDTYWADKTKCP